MPTNTAEFKGYQAAYDPIQPLSKLSEVEKDEAWVNICEELSVLKS